jgi:hypothetical protein
MTSKFISILLVLNGPAVAELPKKVPLSQYSTLWTNSPFTAKPPPPEAVAAVNPLEDYALLGVSPISASGYRVTLINKKQPEERITVDSDKPNTSFKILEVIRKSGDPLGTEVRMSSGSMTGKVTFEQNLLALAQPAPPKPPVNPNIPPINIPPQIGPNGQPVTSGPAPIRQPRPRVIPPPTIQPPTPPAIPSIPQTRPARHGK